MLYSNNLKFASIESERLRNTVVQQVEGKTININFARKNKKKSKIQIKKIL
jgi:hypothetical protein